MITRPVTELVADLELDAHRTEPRPAAATATVVALDVVTGTTTATEQPAATTATTVVSRRCPHHHVPPRPSSPWVAVGSTKCPRSRPHSRAATATGQSPRRCPGRPRRCHHRRRHPRSRVLSSAVSPPLRPHLRRRLGWRARRRPGERRSRRPHHTDVALAARIQCVTATVEAAGRATVCCTSTDSSPTPGSSVIPRLDRVGRRSSRPVRRHTPRASRRG